jgi:hypothetical protein
LLIFILPAEVPISQEQFSRLPRQLPGGEPQRYYIISACFKEVKSREFWEWNENKVEEGDRGLGEENGFVKPGKV